MKKITLITLFFLSFMGSMAQNKTIEEITKGFKKNDGFFNFYYSENLGKVYLYVNQLNTEFLYYPSLASGLGSNDIGLDRGRLGNERIVKFEKHGAKLLLTETNYKFRAISNDNFEKEAVKESFASSVLFGFDIISSDSNGFLIDLSPFLLTDAVSAVEDISRTKQGNYGLDLSRSAIYEPKCKSFPENTEFESIITLKGSNAGNYLREVSPNTDYLSMHQHHSFVKLPDANFKTRDFDPRMGYIGLEFYDYATPINKPIVKKLISKHRLEKKDPNAIISDPVKPIIYYMDRGAPEPIRSALMEGAAWWNQAFEAAGYKNAFQVKLLPEDADPMDVRYNLIQWIHRSTRGWSYGSSIIDPRTGEIIKGKVSLGSLRVRQDYLIAQGLAGNFDTGDDSELLKMSTDRLKQLAAHEVGHTLGLPHNYISSINGRASVMDYPHPLVELKNGKVDFSESYDMGIGDYDKASIQWGYLDLRDKKAEEIELERIVQNTMKRGLAFLTDQDARPNGSVHPQTHLWDNGSNAADELLRMSKIRSFALNQLGEKSIPNKTPIATLEEVLVPMYMFHRYQVQAASKSIGGLYYYNALKGDNLPVMSQVSPEEQRKSFEALLKTLEPEFLALPKNILNLIPPRPFRYDSNPRETFSRHTGMGFDALGPAEASVQLTLELILNPERLSRLSQQKIQNTAQLSCIEVLSRLNTKLWKNKSLYAANSDYNSQLSRLVATMYLQGLIKVYKNKKLSIESKSNVLGAINQLKTIINDFGIEGNGYMSFAKKTIKDFEENTGDDNPDSFFIAPDGQPIDQDYDWLGLECEH